MHSGDHLRGEISVSCKGRRIIQARICCFARDCREEDDARNQTRAHLPESLERSCCPVQFRKLPVPGARVSSPAARNKWGSPCPFVELGESYHMAAGEDNRAPCTEISATPKGCAGAIPHRAMGCGRRAHLWL